MFIVLLSFSESLARDRTKCLSLNDEPCMVRSTLIDLNPVELKCCPFMTSLDKFNGSCNLLWPKICVPKKKYINVKVFHTITNNAKTMKKHISCDCKCKFNSTTHKITKWNKKCQCECKNYLKFKKDYSWNPCLCNCENSK